MVNSNPEVNVKLFAFHCCLYANDLAYNAIIDLKPHISDKDGETRKIYRALEKRAKEYYTSVMKVISDYSYFYADYNSKMDDMNDKNIQSLNDEIEHIYRMANAKDSAFLAKTETARSIVMLSIHLVDSMIRKLKEVGIDLPKLKYYSIKEIGRVMENFSKWVNRKNPSGVNVGTNKHIKRTFDRIGQTLGSYKNFETAWYYASEQDKKRVK